MSNTRDENILIAFGIHLQKVREGKEVSLRQLEVLSEVDFSEIHRIEKGKRNPSLTVLMAIAKGLGVHLKELIEF